MVLKVIRIYIRSMTIFLIMGLSSCIPQSKLLLLQYDQLNDSTYANAFIPEPDRMLEYRIQPNDYLYINVSTIEKELSMFLEPMAGINFLGAYNQALVGYHVDYKGEIIFPYLGTIKLDGFTIYEAHDEVKKAAKDFLGDQIRVDVRLINNVVNIMGEVRTEGNYNMTRNKITIYEAITLAGGFTDYARRSQVKVFRNINGNNTVYLVDLTSGKMIGDNMFYVFPNDMIYVEPMRAKSMGLTPSFSLNLLTTLLTITTTVLFLYKN
jgi:polysaccharide biosynthesis/export protein